MKLGAAFLVFVWLTACGGVDPPICIDSDGDGFGAECATGPDCDDAASSCTTKCGDEDGDGIPGCRDRCTDHDRDHYGTTRPPLEVIGDGAIAVLDCTADGSTPCVLESACIAEDRDDADPLCTDGATPDRVLCLESSLCDGDNDGLADGTPILCMLGIDSDFPGGGLANCSATSPCIFGPWSNSQCGTGGTGWHVSAGSCGTGQGSRMKRCVSIELQPADPCE